MILTATSFLLQNSFRNLLPLLRIPVINEPFLGRILRKWDFLSENAP
jgi:hypothetical protein